MRVAPDALCGVISVGLDHGGKRAAALDDYGQLVDLFFRLCGMARNAKVRALRSGTLGRFHQVYV
jgi:hypothetical protein